MNVIATSVLCLIFLNQFQAKKTHDYMTKRAKLLNDDSQHALGSKLRLSDKETLVNTQLMFFKNVDMDNVPLSGQYFSYRDKMRNTRLYDVIRHMPKGAALHVHGSLMLDPDDLVKLTYEEHLYICLTDNHLKFYASDNIPKQPCPVPWKLLEHIRTNQFEVPGFDAMLKQRLTLGAEDGLNSDSDENASWEQFVKTMGPILSLIQYRPLREKYIYQSLQNFLDDNVLYVEIRLNLYPLYELNGTVHDKLYMAALHHNVAKRFKETNPDFAGLKIILSPSRKLSMEGIQYEVDLAGLAKQKYPDLIAGFDLVGQEDKGKPLKELLTVLLRAKRVVDFYFHAGETRQYGTAVDENLFDAVLLGAKRIGHANALVKHPELMKAVQNNDIAIEVSVISNSVLSVVKDMRSHPLAILLSQGLPVVLSSDDPGVWGARPLTDDFYVAFAGVASRQADLRLLKQLAINSIRYSCFDDRGKTRLFRIFEKRWAEFVGTFIEEYGMGS